MERTARKPPSRQSNGTTVLIPAIPVTDGELLMRYARHGDEGAFAELVEKHGRLVWTVCWQVLREHHAIEDAFQATFFILAKRARTIRSCDSLCGWLYRVAYRTALRARMTAKRKAMVELMADELATLDEKLKNIEQHEQRAILMEELHTLPEQYQMPLVLCYLQGKSRRTAAEELGTTLESVKGRLTRGRQLLRHRLIRRGVSLSFAMAAMTVPVKMASASVTSNLVGLTVAGCGKWLVGAAKATSTTSVTTSTQVLQLAHQGTVAMTLASFAKPAVVAVALLGAMSATLAVDSADRAPAAGGSETVDLLAAAESPDGATISADDETIIEIAAEEKLGIVEKPRQPAPVRVPQPAAARTIAPQYFAPGSPTPPGPISALMQIPAMQVPSKNYPVVQPIDFQFGRLNIELNLKLRTHEAAVAQLQLESKELEIEALEVDNEKDRKALLEQSRKKLLMAEAEQLRMQVERQKEEVKQLEKALKDQAKRAGEQARQAEEQAKHAVEHAKEAAGQLKFVAKEHGVIVLERTRAEAEAAKAAAKAQVAAAREQASTFEPRIQEPALLEPGNRVKIEVVGAFPDRPINDVFTIEPMGTVALGATYGRVNIAGQSLLKAEETIAKHLKKTLTDVQVQVTLMDPSSPRAATINFSSGANSDLYNPPSEK